MEVRGDGDDSGVELIGSIVLNFKDFLIIKRN
jgi:hypothetical protein